MKSAGEKFLGSLRGAKNVSNAFRIVFRIFFRVFQTVFRIDLKFFGGSLVLQACRPKGELWAQELTKYNFILLSGCPIGFEDAPPPLILHADEDNTGNITISSNTRIT